MGLFFQSWLFTLHLFFTPTLVLIFLLELSIAFALLGPSVVLSNFVSRTHPFFSFLLHTHHHPSPCIFVSVVLLSHELSSIHTFSMISLSCYVSIHALPSYHFPSLIRAFLILIRFRTFRPEDLASTE